jgi:hypothetical protein
MLPLRGGGPPGGAGRRALAPGGAAARRAGAAAASIAAPVPRPGAPRGRRGVAARIHIDRRQHLENSWRRQEERAALLSREPPSGEVFDVSGPRSAAAPCFFSGPARARPSAASDAYCVA